MIQDRDKKIAFIKAIDSRITFPINNDLWDYYLNGAEFDYGYKTLWGEFNDFIKDEYNNSIENYTDELRLINMLFNTLSETFKTYPIITKNDLDNTIIDVLTNDNQLKKGYYVSIDLKDAILQCYKYFNIFDEDGIVGVFEKNSFNKNILKFRGNKINIHQILFSGAKENTYWEMCAFLLNKIYTSDHNIISFLKEKNIPLYFINGDDLLFYIGEENTILKDFIDSYCNKDFIINGIECHVNILYYNNIDYKINDEEKTIGYFDNVVTKKRKYTIKNCYYIWQLDKIYRGIPLIDKDRITVGNHYKTVPFLDKITILKNNV